MRTTTSAQRTARLFWGVTGSSLLIVTSRVERLLEIASSRPPRRHFWAWTGSVAVVCGFFVLLIVPQPAVVAAALTPPAARQPFSLACPIDQPHLTPTVVLLS